METRGLRLAAGAALKLRRLEALLGGRDPEQPALVEAVEDAQVLGSLELAGYALSWDAVKAARRGEPSPEPLLGMRRALGVVPPDRPFSVDALLAWHAAVTGGTSGLRQGEREREGGAPPAPAAFVLSRLRILEQWLNVESSREVRPEQVGALALARVVEILPFEDGNGRVARLAASHLMRRAGGRRPILVGADAARLRAALQAAFRLDTEPLCALLEQASERSLDVMIQTLEGRA